MGTCIIITFLRILLWGGVTCSFHLLPPLDEFRPLIVASVPFIPLQSCCTCLVYLWYIYGLFMVYLWFIYGLFMVYLWFIYGLFMVYLWCIYGIFMVYLWFIYGLFMVYLSSIYRPFMVYLWFINGLFMVYLWYIYLWSIYSPPTRRLVNKRTRRGVSD